MVLQTFQNKIVLSIIFACFKCQQLNFLIKKRKEIIKGAETAFLTETLGVHTMFMLLKLLFSM